MTNCIIVLILVVVLYFALKSSKKHMKGEGDCCGGGSVPILEDKILEQPILGKKEVFIDDMVCDRCVYNVKKVLNKESGISAVVSLNKKCAIVSYCRDISNEELIQIVEKAGYKVNNVRDL